jgi:hypothetical protein
MEIISIATVSIFLSGLLGILIGYFTKKYNTIKNNLIGAIKLIKKIEGIIEDEEITPEEIQELINEFKKDIK